MDIKIVFVADDEYTEDKDLGRTKRTWVDLEEGWRVVFVRPGFAEIIEHDSSSAYTDTYRRVRKPGLEFICVKES